MALRVWNTLTRRKDALEPLHPPRLRLFVCGPTVYDESHMGHAKTYTQFDLVARHLRARGLHVEYVQNITDVDDKIIARAQQLGKTVDALAGEQELLFREAMTALGNAGVDRFARASEYIPQMVSQVERLVASGHAYELPDGYYFDISTFAGYGRLARRPPSGATGTVSRVADHPLKRQPGDFVLWKRRKSGEPFWRTSLGEGRPGWHIEDTAITEHLFGPQYDIHGGAVDLIFPHHEAEIAQMESLSQRAPLARYWMHSGLLTLGDAKMSKSAGNALTIRAVLSETPPEVVRFHLTSHHYRSPLEFDRRRLRSAASSLGRLRRFYARLEHDEEPGPPAREVQDVAEDVLSALDDDFDAPAALARLFRFVREQNSRPRVAAGTRAMLGDLDRVFGFIVPAPAPSSDEAWISAEVRRRELLRSEHRYEEADAIRARLAERRIVIEDGEGTSRWYHQTTS